MTRYAPLWQQNSSYPAAVDRGLIGTLWPASGSSGGVATTVLNTMNVSVAAGTAAVALSGSNLSQLCRWDAAEVVTLTAAPPSGQSRIDLVVLQVRDAAIDAGANNDFIFQAITGAGGTPGPGAAPAVPTNAYPICQLTVPGAAANLNGVTVTDRRLPLTIQTSQARAILGRAAAQSIPASTSTTIILDTATFDPVASLQSGGYRCPIAGFYAVDFMVAMAPGSGFLQTSLLKNATTVAYGTSTSLVAFNAATAGSAIVQCAAGDLLAVSVYQSNAAALNTALGIAGTYLHTHLLSI